MTTTRAIFQWNDHCTLWRGLSSNAHVRPRFFSRTKRKVQSFTRVTSTEVSQLHLFFKKKRINWRKSIEMFISRLQQPIGSICRVISLPTPGPTLFQPTSCEISPLGSLEVKEIWNLSGQVKRRSAPKWPPPGHVAPAANPICWTGGPGIHTMVDTL